MQIAFSKYHGTGNDFILIDNRTHSIQLTKTQIAHLCHRRFGIGADGLMLLEKADNYNFRMVYYNADGGESTMCGNGGRCITAFAEKLGVIVANASFVAIDGPHMARIEKNNSISLHMIDVNGVDHYSGYAILNTGSPHYVLWTDDVLNEPVFAKGREIRNRPDFHPNGINVNFVQRFPDHLYVRTYERGVEDETYSCGTGVVASAIADSGNEVGDFVTRIKTPGGKLEVSFTKDSPDTAKNVVLNGTATFVFDGTIEV